MKKESGKPRVVLDTKPIIKLFAQEEGWYLVQKILTKIEAEEVEAAISVVTLTEIYYKYLQEKILVIWCRERRFSNSLICYPYRAKVFSFDFLNF